MLNSNRFKNCVSKYNPEVTEKVRVVEEGTERVEVMVVER